MLQLACPLALLCLYRRLVVVLRLVPVTLLQLPPHARPMVKALTLTLHVVLTRGVVCVHCEMSCLWWCTEVMH